MEKLPEERSDEASVSNEFMRRMRRAGSLAAEVLTCIKPAIAPGVTTEELDRLCHRKMVDDQGVTPACLGYQGFPCSTCISVNDVVCHGIPGPYVLRRGDILNIDVTVRAQGVHGDTSTMFFVGEPCEADRHLCQVTQQALYAAIARVRPGLRLQEIGRCIEQIAHANRLSVVRDYCGHFIGEAFHAPPNVLHYFAEDGGFMLEPGMTFTIEPMLNRGAHAVRTLRDGWTVKTRDGSRSAQYEHTILVTPTGCEVLTWRPEEAPAFPRCFG